MVQVPHLLESIDIQFLNDERLNSLMATVKELSKQLQAEGIDSVISGLAEGDTSLKGAIERAIVTYGEYAVPEALVATMLAEKYRPENAEVAAMYIFIASRAGHHYDVMQISRRIADCPAQPFRGLIL